jgi:hypothetical protein
MALRDIARPLYSESDNPAFNWWLNTVQTVVSDAVQRQVRLTSTSPDTDKYPSEVLPMLKTRWGQEDPYNWMCPMASPSSRCITGCVATAMAQILYYHNHPVHGTGTKTVYYPAKKKSGTPVTADFENDYYDWDSMLEVYISGHYTQEEADAVALLMRDCGIASDMMYDAVLSGSGAYMSDAAYGLRTYLDFPDAEYVSRRNYSDSEWMDMVFYELSNNGPILYSGSGPSSGSAHAFVLHGYNQQGLVYVNWGWEGRKDGYFDISILNPDGGFEGYSDLQDMICGLKSNNKNDYRVEKIDLSGMGTLEQADNLRSINLSDAVLENNAQPDSLFMGCSNLLRLVLPHTLERIGREAFSGCTKLCELRVLTHDVPTLGGQNVFKGVPMNKIKLYVRSGMKSKYLGKAQWKDIGSAAIIETGTSVKAQNITRKYGENNPELKYAINGDSVKGVPEIFCEATATSPAGRYTIHVLPGTIENDEVDYIEGYLIIQKVNATATIGSYTRSMGEPNPEFGIIAYSGLIPSDSVPDWISTPVFTTTADELSQPGDYPITVESASAQSYNVTFIQGTLTITDPDGVPYISIKDNSAESTFTIDGRPAGKEPSEQRIYITQGRKFLQTK